MSRPQTFGPVPAVYVKDRTRLVIQGVGVFALLVGVMLLIGNEAIS